MSNLRTVVEEVVGIAQEIASFLNEVKEGGGTSPVFEIVSPLSQAEELLSHKTTNNYDLCGIAAVSSAMVNSAAVRRRSERRRKSGNPF